MSIDLGFQPIPLTVTLAPDSDFLATLAAATPWQAGTAINLTFTTGHPGGLATVWPASISGVNATWDVLAASVAALIAGGIHYVRLHYTDSSGNRILWGKGSVHVV